MTGPTSKIFASYQRADLSFSSFIYSYTLSLSLSCGYSSADAVVECAASWRLEKEREKKGHNPQNIMYSTHPGSMLSRPNLFFLLSPDLIFDRFQTTLFSSLWQQMKFVHGSCDDFGLEKKRRRKRELYACPSGRTGERKKERGIDE